MRWGTKRAPALRGVFVVPLLVAILLASTLPAAAAGPKRIFITKYDQNFMGQAGVTFELYQDTNGNGVHDDGEPLLQTKVTDAAGRATFDPVNPGKYVVHEVTPAGYADNPDQAVEIPNAKGPGPQIVFSNTPLPGNNRVNDPTGDASFGDGTHLFDFGPSVASTPNGDQILVAWNHSAGSSSPGGFSLVETALSVDGGTRWGDYSKVTSGSPSTFITGEPTVIYDPVRNRWVLATDAVANTGSGLLYDIMVTTSGSPFGWSTPVHIPGMPLAPSVAHGPQVVVDPATGDYGVLFTQSLNDGTSRPMVSHSTDGGLTWTTPSPIAPAGSHFDFVTGGLGPDGRLNTVFGDFSEAGTYDLLFNSAPFDPTVVWPSPSTIASGLPRSGTAGQCGNNGTLRSLFGQIAALDAPSIAADPTDPSGNTVFVATSRSGSAGDPSDVAVFRSTDAGRTWVPLGQTGSEPTRAEFAPEVTVSPDGRVAIAQLLAELRNLQDLQVTVEVRFLTVEDQFFDRIGLDFDLGTPIPVSEGPFDLWQTNPSFDSNYSDCFGLTPIAATSPGSGFFVAWADGRDPGPAGNNGIDPNIYFASTEGVPFPTELSGLVTKTGTKLKVTGDVSPKPLPGARVILTLLRKQGGPFEQIGRKRPRTDEQGDWRGVFRRPDGGKCRVSVEFTGADGRAPSVPISATFPC